jgi:tRNA threonylcarbamoyladenosine biosynthesis protein TsaB
MTGFHAPDAPRGSATVLAIDTTAAVCSVALMRQDGPIRQHWVRREVLTPGQSRAILSQVDAVFQEAGMPPGQIDVLGFGAGPGAFTGLRVACGIAQGLALGWGCPVLGVDSLSTLAWQAHRARAPDSPASRIVAMLDVRMNEVAIAVFDARKLSETAALTDTAPDHREALQPFVQPLYGPHLSSPDEAAAFIRSLIQAGEVLVYAGDGPSAYESLAFAEVDAQARQPDAIAVAELAFMQWHGGRAIDAADAAPFYLRDKVALDRQEQAQLRAARAIRPLPSRAQGSQ